jgi:predicted adenine nucleotide alpha hydrolase (AANH) superfamily ATPase
MLSKKKTKPETSEKKRILLHVCCGPCSTHCLKELLSEYEPTMFFYNPNIHPQSEYFRRLEAAEKVSKHFKVPLKEGGFDVEDWLELIQGFENAPEGGKRCDICFYMRLEETAKFAKENKFDLFTTTLSVSPHKDSDTINRLGRMLGKKHGIAWLKSDFKKNNGFKKSIELSKELALYRQNYCGCFYSDKKKK